MKAIISRGMESGESEKCVDLKKKRNALINSSCFVLKCLLGNHPYALFAFFSYKVDWVNLVA